MAHDAQRLFIEKTKDRFPQFFDNTIILEVGSWNINGTVRDLFTNQIKYVGLDLAPGHCVDVVCSGALYDTDLRFDVAISAECLEHDSQWEKTFANMIRLTRSGGIVIFTCASYQRPEHGTPRTSPEVSLSSQLSDYYRNLGIKDFELMFNMQELFTEYAFEINGNCTDLYFWGLKR